MLNCRNTCLSRWKTRKPRRNTLVSAFFSRVLLLLPRFTTSFGHPLVRAGNTSQTPFPVGHGRETLSVFRPRNLPTGKACRTCNTLSRTCPSAKAVGFYSGRDDSLLTSFCRPNFSSAQLFLGPKIFLDTLFMWPTFVISRLDTGRCLRQKQDFLPQKTDQAN
jgi:hypothetical protein